MTPCGVIESDVVGCGDVGGGACLSSFALLPRAPTIMNRYLLPPAPSCAIVIDSPKEGSMSVSKARMAWMWRSAAMLLVAVALAGGILVRTAGTAHADYGSGAQYQVEISSNPGGFGIWLWAELGPGKPPITRKPTVSTKVVDTPLTQPRTMRASCPAGA